MAKDLRRDKASEAMLKKSEDIERSKPADRSPLDPDWLMKQEVGKGEYWAGLVDESGGRRWGAAFSHLLYALGLLAELIMWAQVMHIWRSSRSTEFFAIFLPVVLPSLIIPALVVFHSLARGAFSLKDGVMLVVPPSPILYHLGAIYCALKKKDMNRMDRSSRVAGMVQACLMSFPLLILSYRTILLGMLDSEIVDAGKFHRQMYENRILFFASTVSFANLLVAAFKYNERLTGRPVSVLVGLPFLFSNILFRLVGFGLLFSLFEGTWIALCLGILLSMSALSVQLSSNFTVCGKIFRAMFGDQRTVNMEKKTSILSSMLLSVGGVLIPMGYTRDLKLGHVSGRGWRLILVNSIGSLAILSTVISTAIVQYIPNTFSGEALVRMILNMAEMEVTIKTGGKQFTMDLPKTQINIMADNPAKASFSLSPHDDIFISYLVPAFLCLLCLPFTVLRILLLGWDCRLESKRDEDEDSFPERRGASSGRSCCAVMWSICSLMSFTSLVSLVLGTFILCSVLTHLQPNGVPE